MPIKLFILVVALGFAVCTVVAFVKNDRHYRGHESRRDRLLRRVAWIGALNFCAFIIGDLLLGGDALNGRIEAGRYFLGDHGTYTEVSHAIFIYSACHAFQRLSEWLLLSRLRELGTDQREANVAFPPIADVSAGSKDLHLS